MEKNNVKVDTIDGEFLCVQCFDCFDGDLIDVYDKDNNYVGYIHGNLSSQRMNLLKKLRI